MNNNNYIFYAIIIYIITIILLIIIKPDLIYDHKKKKYKEFGYTKDKTMFPITIVSIFLAITIIVILSFLYDNEQPTPTPTNIQYIPQNYQYMQGGNIPNVMMYPQVQQVQQVPQIIYPQQIPVNIQIPSSGGKTTVSTVSSEQINPKINIMYKLVPISKEDLEEV